MADELKAQGNAAFSSGKFEEAIELFSQAIEKDPSNHVLFSNRSACQASLKNWDSALEDAQKCVEIKPEWPKGYSRLGGALYGKREFEEAVAAYKRGLDTDGENATLKAGLHDAEQALAGPGPGAAGGGGGGIFGPQFLAKLAMNAETRGYLAQPDFKAMLDACAGNPQAMMTYMKDPRFSKALEVGLGLKLGTDADMGMGGGGDEGGGDEVDGPGLTGARGGAGSSSGGSAGASTTHAEPTKAKAPEPELSEEERADKEARDKALEEKSAGNEAYKAKRFDEAIERYNKAIELYGKDVSFVTNRAAANFEKGDYGAAIADCELAVERARETRPIDFKLVAKAMTRHGNCLIKQGDLEGAIDVLNRALTEHRTPDALKLRDGAERTLKQQRDDAYEDTALAVAAKDEGNAAFKAADYPKAVERYSEALQRGPPGKWPEAYKVFSNRAACYTKLGALPQAEKDADKCIELEPGFAKGYIRKAHVQFFTRDYEKALATYEAGLSHDADNAELKEGVWKCQQALNRFLSGAASEDEVKERQARAMSDPDVQNIMTDPVMQQVLKDCQENPGSLSKHMGNPGIAAKLKKLMTAGIIRMS